MNPSDELAKLGLLLIQAVWLGLGRAEGQAGLMHVVVSKLFSFSPGHPDLDWPASAWASLTESVRMPSTGETGEAGQAQPD